MTTEAHSRPLLAGLWMTGAIVSFSAMAVAGRAVSFELDTFELMMYRSLIGIVIVLAVGGLAGTLNQITTRRMGLQTLRNVAHFTGQNLWFFAITVAPLAQVFALEFTTPIWVALLAPLFLPERLTRTRILAALIGFTGILVVARPTLETVNAGLITAALAAIAFAATTICTKRLTRTETTTCILFWLTVIQALLGLVATGWDGDIALPSTETAPWIIVVGCGGLLAHFCITNALHVAPASVVMPFDFARLPVIALIGALLYGEALEIWVFVGAGLIFSAIYLNIWSERPKARP